jgi:hypothetical protein
VCSAPVMPPSAEAKAVRLTPSESPVNGAGESDGQAGERSPPGRNVITGVRNSHRSPVHGASWWRQPGGFSLRPTKTTVLPEKTRDPSLPGCYVQTPPVHVPLQHAGFGVRSGAAAQLVAGAAGSTPDVTQQVLWPGASSAAQVALAADPSPVVQHAPVVPGLLLHRSFRSEQHRVLGLAPPRSEAVHVRAPQHELGSPAHLARPVRH